MPIHVDREQRLAAIAAATVRVAGSAGLRGVTIRSVAAALDASTTFITNYLPTRAALLVNALREIEAEWIAELEDELAVADPAVALRRAMRSAVRWDDEELLRSHFWIAVLAAPERDREVQRHLDESTAAVQALFTKLVDQCGHPDAEAEAERLLLLAQGAFVSIVESPSTWTNDKLRRIADRAVDRVLGPLQSSP